MPVARTRVLVVDDNHDIADSTAALLAMHGHKVEVAYDGPSALAAVERYKPDTVLLDISMPRMDGIEVAKRIRALPLGKRVKLVVVTGNATLPRVADLAGADVDCVLAKPVDWCRADNLSAILPHEAARYGKAHLRTE
jgi:CheY-like chemotaxis protein